MDNRLARHAESRAEGRLAVRGGRRGRSVLRLLDLRLGRRRHRRLAARSFSRRDTRRTQSGEPIGFNRVENVDNVERKGRVFRTQRYAENAEKQHPLRSLRSLREIFRPLPSAFSASLREIFRLPLRVLCALCVRYFSSPLCAGNGRVTPSPTAGGCHDNGNAARAIAMPTIPVPFRGDLWYNFRRKGFSSRQAEKRCCRLTL